MTFIDLLQRSWQQKNSLVCVGLDPDYKRIPGNFQTSKQPLFAFNKCIIDATVEYTCAYKPQIAYYSCRGAESELEKTIAYIHQYYPGVPVILDAKRGDIGSTAEMYAQEVFERYDADAVTVNPYMGGDTIQPFLKRQNKGVVVLCRTSNPGSGDFQEQEIKGKKLYQLVAEKALNEWNQHNQIVLVVGATYPQELKKIRDMSNNIPLLVPGIGAQGGSVEQAVTNGQCSYGAGMIINSSRGIIFAGSNGNTAQAAAQAAQSLRDTINQFRKNRIN